MMQEISTQMSPNQFKEPEDPLHVSQPKMFDKTQAHRARVIIPQVQAIDPMPSLPTKLSLPYPVDKKPVPITTMQFEGEQ